MIFRETRDWKNKCVAKTVEELYKFGYRHGTDTSRWNELNKSKLFHQKKHSKHHVKQLYLHFIKELELGRYIVDDTIPVHCRVPFFIKDEKDKGRFIPDYSAASNGVSVNSLVPPNDATVEFNDKFELINFTYNNGKTTQLGKNDAKSFYRQFPMARSDWSISVYHWNGIDFIDTRMPWGTRTASKVAHHMSLAIAYIAYKYIPRALQPCIFNYIDDHILRAHTQIQALYVHIIYILVCQLVGIQLNQKKTVLAAQDLEGLGIQLNVKTYQVSITSTRVKDITKHLIELHKSNYATAKFGQKVAGKCEDIAFLLYPLRVYLRYLRDAIPAYQDEKQTFKVTPEIRSMCVHWIRALHYIKGRRMTHILHRAIEHTIPCYTDASNKGYGIFYNGHWLYGAFEKHEVKTDDQNNICDRELFPILIAARTFGPEWTGRQILFYIDNTNACQAIAKKDIRMKTAHALLVQICEAMMEFQFELVSFYIKTKDNILADSLSRFEFKKFKAHCNVKQIDYDQYPTPFQRPTFPK